MLNNFQLPFVTKTSNNDPLSDSFNTMTYIKENYSLKTFLKQIDLKDEYLYTFMSKYANYISKMEFDTEPDYQYLEALVLSV